MTFALSKTTTSKLDNFIKDIIKCDIVMGNPPYQDGSENKGKRHTLWTQFVQKAFEKFLTPNGYLVFIHPSLWRQYGHELLNLMKCKQILYLEIHNSDDGMKTFRCATRYDWYVLQNIKCSIKTTIKCENNKIYIVNLHPWIF